MLDMGPLESNGWGMTAKPDGAILDYMRGTGITTEPWEFRALRQMCRAYRDGNSAGKDPLCIPPIDRRAG